MIARHDGVRPAVSDGRSGLLLGPSVIERTETERGKPARDGPTHRHVAVDDQGVAHGIFRVSSGLGARGTSPRHSAIFRSGAPRTAANARMVAHVVPTTGDECWGAWRCCQADRILSPIDAAVACSREPQAMRFCHSSIAAEPRAL